jgi:hypothetical protein
VKPSRFAIFVLLATTTVYAQERGGGQRGAAQVQQTAKAAAPFDITGYWVSIVTEDWRWRMTTPPKGDYAGVPLNPEGRQIADAWDPAKDEASGDQCKSYGAANLMRVPGRLHITWQDDQTLKVEMDAGSQTRLFSFGVPRSQGGDWQGVSRAEWEFMPTLGGFSFAPIGKDSRSGSLKVVTTRLRAGYLRKNGVPYSANAILTEYYDLVREPNNDFLVLTTTVEDPTYLTQPFLTSAHFRKQADATGWNPTSCLTR